MITFNLTKKRQSKKLLNRFTTLETNARNAYRNNNFSGHPDEQLEFIDNCAHMVDSIKSAQDRGFSVHPSKVEEAAESLLWWKKNTVHPEGSKKYIAGVTNYQNILDWTKAGLI